MQVLGRRVGGSRRLLGGALLVSVAVIGAGIASNASAGVTNPGAVSVHFAGTLSINASVPVVIPGIAGDATGTIDSTGAIALPLANISFASFPVVVAGVLPTTVAIQPLADWTGNLDPDTGAMTVTASLNAIIDLSGLGLGAACPIGPIILNWTTGVSGLNAANHGTPYDPATGTAGIIDATFPIPAVPTAPAPAGCPGASTLNSLGPLPVAANVSTAVFTATITPHPFGSTTTSSSTTTTPSVTPPPEISVGNGAILEGDVGTHVLSIPVTRTDFAIGTSTVKYAVTKNTAKGGSAPGGGVDFKTASGTLTFTGSTVQKTISITVYGDTSVEKNETLNIKLSTPTNGTLRRSAGTGTILNDDAVPHPKFTIGAGDAAVVIGDAGNQTLSFPVTLSKATTKTVKVHFVIAGISAVAGVDFFRSAMSGTLSIAAGKRQGAVTVTVFAHSGSAATKTLKITLSSPSGGPTGTKLLRAKGTGTLINP